MLSTITLKEKLLITTYMKYADRHLEELLVILGKKFQDQLKKSCLFFWQVQNFEFPPLQVIVLV